MQSTFMHHHPYLNRCELGRVLGAANHMVIKNKCVSVKVGARAALWQQSERVWDEQKQSMKVLQVSRSRALKEQMRDGGNSFLTIMAVNHSNLASMYVCMCARLCLCACVCAALQPGRWRAFPNVGNDLGTSPARCVQSSKPSVGAFGEILLRCCNKAEGVKLRFCLAGPQSMHHHLVAPISDLSLSLSHTHTHTHIHTNMHTLVHTHCCTHSVHSVHTQ